MVVESDMMIMMMGGKGVSLNEKRGGRRELYKWQKWQGLDDLRG
jgi:hypothetical protein